jgi:hypothetical protein
MRGAVLLNLRKWLATLDETARDKPIVASADGAAITPRLLVTHVQKSTPIGRRYVAGVQRLALDHAMEKFAHIGGPGLKT